MKKTLFYAAIALTLFFAACSKKQDDPAPVNPRPPLALVGAWKLIDQFQSDGTQGKWYPVEDGLEFTLNADSTYTTTLNPDTFFATNGKAIFLNDYTWQTKYSYGINSAVPPPNLKLSANADTLYMVSYQAIEGAAVKFVRLQTQLCY